MVLKRFWMVHRVDDGSTPSLQYDSLDSACGEAERLALKQPGHSFAVLALARLCRARKPVEWTNYTLDP